MRMFFGIILGIIITLGAAYIHDVNLPAPAAVIVPVPTDPSAPTPPQPVGAPTDLTQKRIVNWEVLSAIKDSSIAWVTGQWNKLVQ